MESPGGYEDRAAGAVYGMFIGDALAMPVHWYYDTAALRRDYGEVRDYLPPQNPHPDSILWRSSYTAPNRRGDILHDQARYWGRRNIHYHQFLRAGDNTLNLTLGRELLLLLEHHGAYSAEAWLGRLIAFMTTPGSHRDTYAEEYLRHFFSAYARGSEPRHCGRRDEKHIGGFSLMLPLLLAMGRSGKSAEETALEHLSLTHGGTLMRAWGALLADIMLRILQGEQPGSAIAAAADASSLERTDNYAHLFDAADETVVGRLFSSACYVEYAVPATFYLALKYRDDPEQALIANTMCGGDNAGRGAVLGALLGGVHGLAAWPRRWIDGLRKPPPIVHIEP